MSLPPLLLLHGFTGSPRSWERVRERLRVERSVCAPALVGHAGAANDAEVHGFEDEVDRLAALLGDAPPVHVAGYSLGGRLALGMLARHPRRVSGATLISAHPGLATDEEREARRRDDERWCALLEERGLEAFVAAWEALPLFASQDALPEVERAVQRRERLAHVPEGLARSLRATGLGVMPAWLPALRTVAVPVRVLVGERDAKFCALAETMAAASPRVRVERIAGAGHNLLMERPDRVAAALDEVEDET